MPRINGRFQITSVEKKKTILSSASWADDMLIEYQSQIENMHLTEGVQWQDFLDLLKQGRGFLDYDTNVRCVSIKNSHSNKRLAVLNGKNKRWRILYHHQSSCGISDEDLCKYITVQLANDAKMTLALHREQPGVIVSPSTERIFQVQ